MQNNTNIVNAMSNMTAPAGALISAPPEYSALAAAELPTGPLHPFCPMATFAQTYPPSEPFVAQKSRLVYLHPSQRLNITLERTGDIGYGIWREEKLGDLNQSGACLDSAEFADQLMAAIGDHLSMRNLRDLCERFARELTQLEASREAFHKKYEFHSA